MVETHQLSANIRLKACCCLLGEDGTGWLVALPKMLQGMRCSRCPNVLQGPTARGQAGAGRFQRLPRGG